MTNTSINKITYVLSLFEIAFGRPAEKADAEHISLEYRTFNDLIKYKGNSFGSVDKDFVLSDFISFISEGRNKKPG